MTLAKLLTKGHERLDEHRDAKLLGLLEAGDPHGEVRLSRHANETEMPTEAMNNLIKPNWDLLATVTPR